MDGRLDPQVRRLRRKDVPVHRQACTDAGQKGPSLNCPICGQSAADGVGRGMPAATPDRLKARGRHVESF